MTRKGIIIIGLLLISAGIIPFVIFSLQFFMLVPIGGGGNGTMPTDPSTEYTIIAPTLEPITPNPSTSGVITLDWNDAEVINSGLPSELELSYYRIYKRKDSGLWKLIIVRDVEFYYDYGLADGVYEYKVQSVWYKPIEVHYSEYSAVQSVVVDVKNFPSNPSIIINNGETTTNSLEVTLTLSCDNADEMQFQISEDIWINWIAYTTTYIITLFENDPAAPDYRIGVKFRNEDGTTEDAGYGDIYDDITYVEPPVPPPIPPKEEIDYTLAYVLIGVLIGLFGIGVFLKYRKQTIKSK
ncbi:hypothetical protein LCGC14_1275130 [marine sediment metagenome]|uniref:Fibronectin type-III domain-containing protein n=1 Tax=marine sediment metagenome TaxID=412755 RepID=A0A0F9KWW1_9ZZZZ